MTTQQAPTYSRGLEGVIADESKICKINGQDGKLYYYGYSIYDIAANHATFDEVTYLLLHGALPSASQLAAFGDSLRSQRRIPAGIIDLIKAFPKDAHAMQALQTLVSALGMYDTVEGKELPSHFARSTALIAQFPTLIAAFARHRAGKDILEPRPDLDHSANFLYMVNGEAPSAQAAKTFEMALILHMEHGFNASTFTARVVGSTLTNIYSTVSAAVGALFGPLHGGANEGALEMIEEIGSLENAEGYVVNKLANKGKIMGMGHRVYRAKDPRSVVLEGMLSDLVDRTGNRRDYDILKRVEGVMKAEMEKRGKDVYPNVDFFSGALYRMLGIEVQYFTCIFALARVVGWTAHVLELWSNNRLYRPTSYYAGSIDVPWTPMAQRG